MASGRRPPVPPASPRAPSGTKAAELRDSQITMVCNRALSPGALGVARAVAVVPGPHLARTAPAGMDREAPRVYRAVATPGRIPAQASEDPGVQTRTCRLEGKRQSSFFMGTPRLRIAVMGNSGGPFACCATPCLRTSGHRMSSPTWMAGAREMTCGVFCENPQARLAAEPMLGRDHGYVCRHAYGEGYFEWLQALKNQLSSSK